MKPTECTSSETGKECMKELKPPYFRYRNHSHLPDPDDNKPITIPGRIPTFPAKLFAILSRPEFADIISWMPHGRSWKIHKPREFEVKVIPCYFDHAKFSSFIRQANGWGFKRITTKGTDRNSHYHELFLRGIPHLIKFMKRPVSGTKALQQTQDRRKTVDPNFYLISEDHPLPELPPKHMHPLDETSFTTKTPNNQGILRPRTSKIAIVSNHSSFSSLPTLAANVHNPQEMFERDGHYQNQLSASWSIGSPTLSSLNESHEGVSRRQEKELDPLTILLNDLSEEHTQIDDPIIFSLMSDPRSPVSLSLSIHSPVRVSPDRERPLMHHSQTIPRAPSMIDCYDSQGAVHQSEDFYTGRITIQEFY